MSQLGTLGKYHILERLAADEVAEVHKVKTLGIAGFEKVQVLKRILPAFGRDPRFIRSFIDESKIAFSLNHRNIVQVFEFGKVEGDLFVAMEYIPGVNLAKALLQGRQRRRVLPIGLTCYLMGEVAAGLEYAHRKADHFGQELGIVHCDVSPRNVACSFEGSVKILDFGISRAVWTMVPRQARARGEVHYLSPEQVRGESLDSRSDLFSFGVILWELLTGRKLFDGGTPEAVMGAVLRAPIPSPRSINPDVTPQLEEVTMRCLVRETDSRIASASDLQLELHRIQRMLGAVIGSRALSTFLEDLFPDHNDARDVRQEVSAHQAYAESEVADDGAEIDALVDAAAELAEPHNPPAMPVLESRPVGPAHRARRSERLDRARRAVDPLEEPLTAPPSQLGRIAGVLRTRRELDEDVTVGPPRGRRGKGSGPIAAIPSDEVTAGPVYDEPTVIPADERPGARPAFPPLPGPEPGEAALDDASLDDPSTLDLGPSAEAEVADDELPLEDLSLEEVVSGVEAGAPREALAPESFEGGLPEDELSFPDLMRQEDAELEDDDDTTAPPGPSPLVVERSADGQPEPAPRMEAEPERAAELEPAPDPLASDQPAHSPAPPPSAVATPAVAPIPSRVTDLDAAPTESLGERKRCILAAVLLDGAGTGQSGEELIADIAFKLDGIVHERGHAQLVVLFGLPAADEHDVTAAVRFALDAREALVRGLEQSAAGDTPAVRIGIRAGLARVAGAPEGGYQLLGHTLPETVALAQHAPRGQILIAGAAATLASTHYVLRELPPLIRRGKQLRCHRLLGPRMRARRRRSAGLGVLIGREVETRAIRNAWREVALRGSQRTVLLTGEAGLGKSRLCDEFLVSPALEATPIAASATPHRRGTAYGVVIDLLRSAAGVWSGSGPRSRGRLLEALQQMLASDEQSLETLATLLGRREGGPPEAGGGLSRRRVPLALRALLNRIGASRPVVVVVEDLHWADSASLEAIKQLVEHPDEATAPTFLLLSNRPEEGIAPQSLFDHESAAFLLLEELDERDRERLIVEELGDRAEAEVVEEVVRRAGGNPFYIRELCRAVSEQQIDGGASEIPPTVQGLLASRVDRLPAQVKLVLQHAAVIGPTFREGILAKLVGRNPARSLALLRNRGIIVPGLRTAVPTGSAAGLSEQFEREWAFRHVLIQEVVYDAISSTARRSLHRRVSEIMGKRLSRGSSDAPGEVARHLELSGQGARASEFYLRAADEAASSFASREALELYDTALRLGGDDPKLHYQARAGRERVYGQLGMHVQQATDLAALRRLCRDDPARLADLHNREALHCLRLGEFYRALAAAEQAEAAAERASDPLARGEALRLRGEAYDRLNDHPRAIDAVTRALELFEQQSAKPMVVRARIALGRIALGQARYDEANSHYQSALDLCAEAGDRWQERILRNDLAIVHYCRGDFGKALDEAEYSLRLCEQLGDRAREGDNASVIGIVYLELGLHDLARGHLEGAIAIHRETGSQWSEADTMVYAGLLEAAARSFQSALRLLEGAKSIAERIGARSIAVNARNAIAWTLCERAGANDAARAVDEATEAAETARAAGLIVGEIPGLSRSARATALLGNLEAARALSRRAVELLDEQRIIESSEEEIYYTHFRILSALQDPGALEHLEKAHTGLMSKLVRIEDEEQRAAFSDRVRLNAAISRDYLRLRTDPQHRL